MYRLSSIILVLFGCVQIFAQSSPHGKELNIDCAKCHTSESWDIDYKTLKFDHSITDFVLEGTHLQTNCTDCHTSLVFKEAKTDCISCHTDLHSQSVGNDCARCHTPKSWVVNNIPELHEANGFPLAGSHNTLDCVECHTSETRLRFDRIGNDCINCHRDNFINTRNPNHTDANFSTSCTDCHSASFQSWTPVSIKHDFFPLTSGHDIQNCLLCHTSGNFEGISTDCVSCHQTTFDTTTNPNHTAAGFDTNCISCHTTDPNWTPSNFDHSFFPLTLGHDINDCKACHTTASYADQTADCVSCHQSNFDNATSINHTAAGFSTDCTTCHTPSSWTESNFDHNFFPLTQGHDITDCLQCHNTGAFTDQTADCVSCHQTNFDATTNPNHTTAGFPTDCVVCHTTNPGWTPSSFDHNFFPLTQGHDLTDCTQCHIGGNYTNTPTDCVSCHQTNYDNTTNPNHVSAGFNTDCVACHTTNPGWTPATFDHSSFPLTLGHDLADCTQCHTTNPYSSASTDCVSCHQATYDATTNPNHVSAGFPTDCVACHTTNPGWTPSTFDHSLFPLTLGHNITDCTQCHASGVYAGTPTNCVSCHQTNYDATTNPNHVSAGFNTDCVACHTTNPGWTPSTFDHSLFPLTLGHNITDCTQCHTSGVYSGTSPDCASCHITNYNNATNPSHIAAGFPTDCITCHTTNPGWTPSTFDHDGQYFPIYSGKHQGTWTTCSECHTTANNFVDFSCIACHEHNNQTSLNNEHNGVSGYTYTPTSCFDCHPNGNSD